MNKELNTVLHFLSWFRATLNKEYNTVNTPEEGGGWEMGGNKKNELFFYGTIFRSLFTSPRPRPSALKMTS